MAIDPNKQLPGGPKTINEEFFDALIRHQIGLMRLSGSIKKEVFRLLNATEQDMADKIRARLAKRSTLETPKDVNRMQSLLKAIRATRLAAWKDITELWVKEMVDLAKAEPAFTNTALKTVVPTVLETTLPSVELLRGLVSSRPFQGKTLRDWAKNVSSADLRRIEDQIKIGMVQGESSDAIARRVVGTKLLRGRDGVTEIARRQAAGVTRTAVNAIANHSRREFYKANAALFQLEVYTATLDSRTTPICQSLDGQRFPIGEGAIPPVHFQCRSIRVAVIDGEVIGARPARAFTEPGLVREFTKTKGLKGINRRKDLPRGTKGEFDKFKRKRVRELTGQVPAKVTYGEWLGRQSVDFQNDILGQTKGRLFRKGGLKLDKFVDRAGNELPLRELARTQADAFRSAGLNPEEFL